MTQDRWCPECSDVVVFEVPPCVDGHGEDCPDLACTLCGFALVLGAPVEVALVVRTAA